MARANSGPPVNTGGPFAFKLLCYTEAMKEENLLITIGNVYLDRNASGIMSAGENYLRAGKEYFASSYETVIGGSAVNFAMQAVKLGMRVAFAGRVGDDEDGEEIKRLLSEKGIIPDLVITGKGDQTSVTVNVILDHNAEFIGVHWGNASRNLETSQLDLDHSLFQKATAVYFGGTAKQPHIFTSLPSLLRRLHDMGKKVILDPNRLPIDHVSDARETFLESLQYVDCYLPNEEEIKGATMQEDVDAAMNIVMEKGVKMLVVKKGANGCRVKTATEDISLPGFSVTPKTTVGAGDSFNSGFITQLLAGKSLSECARYANAVAAVKVRDTSIPTTEQVEEFLKENS